MDLDSIQTACESYFSGIQDLKQHKNTKQVLKGIAKVVSYCLILPPIAAGVTLGISQALRVREFQRLFPEEGEGQVGPTHGVGRDILGTEVTDGKRIYDQINRSKPSEKEIEEGKILRYGKEKHESVFIELKDNNEVELIIQFRINRKGKITKIIRQKEKTLSIESLKSVDTFLNDLMQQVG